MKSTKNMLLNEVVLGYVPSAIDPNRGCDQEYNLQVHLPRKYSRGDAEECVNTLRGLLLQVSEFDYKSVRVVRHKPCDGAYFHHVHHEEVARMMHLSPVMLAFHIYNRHLSGRVKLVARDIEGIHPLDTLS